MSQNSDSGGNNNKREFSMGWVIGIVVVAFLLTGKVETWGNLAVQNQMGNAIVSLANGQQDMALDLNNLGGQIDGLTTTTNGILNWTAGAQSMLGELSTGMNSLTAQVGGLSQQQAQTARDVSLLGARVDGLSTQIQTGLAQPAPNVYVQPPPAPNVYVQPPPAPNVYVQPPSVQPAQPPAMAPTPAPAVPYYGGGGMQSAGMFNLVGEPQPDIPLLAAVSAQTPGGLTIRGVNGEPDVECLTVEACVAMLGGGN